MNYALGQSISALVCFVLKIKFNPLPASVSNSNNTIYKFCLMLAMAFTILLPLGFSIAGFVLHGDDDTTVEDMQEFLGESSTGFYVSGGLCIATATIACCGAIGDLIEDA